MVATTGSPRSRALAGALRQARESEKITMRTVGSRIGLSHSVISYWENGKRTPRLEDVASYLTAIGVVGDKREHILDLARDASKSDWLPTGIPGIAQQLDGVLECERHAKAITEWCIGTVPGLLQTSDYARAIIGQETPEAEAKVRLRISRRDGLTKRNPVRLTALLSEMALHQIIGGREVMVEQMHYLLKMAELDTIELRVVQVGEGWHPGLAGPFVVYDFPAAPSIVHLEHHRNGAFLDNADDVAAYQDAADRVRQVAMSPDDSLKLIADVANRME